LQKVPLAVGTLPAGVYTLRLLDERGGAQQVRVVK
jgi:hypothetical protein